MVMKLWLRVFLLGVVTVAISACSTTGGFPNQYQQANKAEQAREDQYVRSIGIGHRHKITALKEQNVVKKRDARAQLQVANKVYYFGLNKSTIKPAYMASIDAQANYLLSHPHARIRIEGNTDERGSREYNISLGWRRSKAVARLMRQLGVPRKQLVLVSYGEEKPIALGSNEAAWRLNRRANLVYEAY